MLVKVGRRFVSEQRNIDPQYSKGMKELLSKSKVFQDCHDEFIRDLIVSSNRKEYPPNRYLMDEGCRGDSMFVLFKGVVEVTANGRYVCKLRDGSIVGEAALMSIDNRRTASVRSCRKCDVAIIFRSTFHSILEKFPWEKRKFQREMKSKLMELGKLIDMKEDLNLEQQAVQCDALMRVPFFAADEVVMHDFVAELAMNAASFWFRPGRVIIQEGDTRCDEMYVLLRGAVEISSCGKFLGRLENDLFGEICVMDLLEKRPMHVAAATQCHCMVFTRQVVIPVLAKYPDARIRLLEHARRRLLSLNNILGAGNEDAQTKMRSLEVLSTTAQGFGPTVLSADARLFAASPIFRNGRLNFLREVSHLMITKKFNEGKTIIDEGMSFSMSCDFVYWIAKGEVEVMKGGHFVTLLSEGSVFGDIAFFKGGLQRCSIISKTQVFLRKVRGELLQELLQSCEDQDILEKWHEDVEKRLNQLTHKETLYSQISHKTTHIDFMFMKLSGVGMDGGSMPKTEPLGQTLIDALNIKSGTKTPTMAMTLLPGVVPDTL